jgi:oligopeptidase B
MTDFSNIPHTTQTTPPTPPVARRELKRVTMHGDTRNDDYDWLREKDAQEVRGYLEAENEYTEALLRPLAPLRDKLYAEMVGRVQETDSTVPCRELGYYYYSRTEEGKQYTFHCRRRAALEAREEVLLDLNAIAVEHAYLALGSYAVADAGRYLAYSIDTTGFREYTLLVKDLEEDRMLPWRVEKTGDIVWAGDGKSLLYTVEDELKRPYRVLRHQVGGTGADELVYEERDARFRVSVWRSRSLTYLFIASASHTATEIRYVDASRPGDDWLVVLPREADHEYDIDHREDRFYIRTNRDARNFRLVSAPIADLSPEHWTELVPHRADVMLEWFDVFAEHCVLLETKDGLPQLRVLELATADSHLVEFPESVCCVAPGDNREFDTSVLRFRYESMVTPASVYDYDMASRERTLLKRAEVVGGYDPDHYRSERIHARAPDGTRVPISLVMRRDLSSGPAPLLLYGYGAYGISLPFDFSSHRLSLLDRGVVFAQAHVRGGGELGKLWHDAGRMEAKGNTFSDFIACAEHLITGGYTASHELVIEGGSAGGLLLGAVVNARPELFRAVLGKVPFVDVLNTMLDASLPLTVGEYEEWGNPNEREAYERIRSYCPYTNLEKKAYPAILIRTSLNDSQVMYWEPAKYVAKLRALKTDSQPLMLDVNMQAGHHGPSGRYDHLKELALEYAFILDQLGIRE